MALIAIRCVACAALDQEAGLPLEAGRQYSFVVQVDYDMGYFFGELGGAGSGIGQGPQQVNSVGAGRIEWCAAYHNIVHLVCISFNPLLCARFGPSGLTCWPYRAQYDLQGAVAAVGSERRGAA